MIQRIKDILNNSIVWLLFLISCIFMLWKREKDLESELAETKVEGDLKDEKEKIKEVDHDAATISERYKQLRDKFIAEHKDDV